MVALVMLLVLLLVILLEMLLVSLGGVGLGSSHGALAANPLAWARGRGSGGAVGMEGMEVLLSALTVRLSMFG